MANNTPGHRRVTISEQFSERFSRRSFTQRPSLVDENDRIVDKTRIRQAVEETGVHSFGILAVEVWLLDESDGMFTCPEGGDWIDPLLLHSLRDSERRDALKRIVDPDHPEYMPPLPQIAGTGLVGYFWSFVSSFTLTPSSGSHRMAEPLNWRELNAITTDPDQQPDPRLDIMVGAGIGKGVGVPFDIFGQRGMVVYLARGTANVSMLNESENAYYLRCCASFIGTAAAMTRPRHVAAESRQRRISRQYRTISTRMSVLRALTSVGQDSGRPPSKTNSRTPTDQDTLSNYSGTSRRNRRKIFGACIDYLTKACFGTQSAAGWLAEATVTKAKFIANKSRGCGIQPPPAMPISCAWVSFVGSFITLMVIFGISRVIEISTNGEYEIGIRPMFAALMSLTYGLPPAPATQPRNIIYSQIMSCMGGLVIRWLLMDIGGMPSWVVGSFVASASIFLMAVTGVLHPPSSAAAYTFVTGNLGIVDFLLFMFGQCIAIVVSIFINNWSDKRQYPVYWRFGFVDLYMVTKKLALKACSRRNKKRQPSMDHLELPTVSDDLDDKGEDGSREVSGVVVAQPPMIVSSHDKEPPASRTTKLNHQTFQSVPQSVPQSNIHDAPSDEFRLQQRPLPVTGIAALPLAEEGKLFSGASSLRQPATVIPMLKSVPRDVPDGYSLMPFEGFTDEPKSRVQGDNNKGHGNEDALPPPKRENDTTTGKKKRSRKKSPKPEKIHKLPEKEPTMLTMHKEVTQPRVKAQQSDNDTLQQIPNKSRETRERFRPAQRPSKLTSSQIVRSPDGLVYGTDGRPTPRKPKLGVSKRKNEKQMPVVDLDHGSLGNGYRRKLETGPLTAKRERSPNNPLLVYESDVMGDVEITFGTEGVPPAPREAQDSAIPQPTVDDLGFPNHDLLSFPPPPMDDSHEGEKKNSSSPGLVQSRKSMPPSRSTGTSQSPGRSRSRSKKRRRKPRNQVDPATERIGSH